MKKEVVDKSPSNVLPSKEQQNFRTLMRLYDQKSYKKANKIADSILKKHPQHGETLSMKGLILSSLCTAYASLPASSSSSSGQINNFNIQKNKKLAYEFAKKGIRYDLKSHMAWHVLGLIYRADKDYEEALKSWVCALKLDSENLQILRDICALQIHLRKLKSFRETRRTILAIRPRFTREWTALALAHHLCGDLRIGLSLLDAFQVEFENVADMDKYEISEMVLYKAMIMEEMGEFQKCVEYLKEKEDIIVDKVSLWELMGRLHIFLNQRNEAFPYYVKLFSRNRENEAYLVCLLSCYKNEGVQNMFFLPPPYSPPLPSQVYNVSLPPCTSPPSGFLPPFPYPPSSLSSSPSSFASLSPPSPSTSTFCLIVNNMCLENGGKQKYGWVAPPSSSSSFLYSSQHFSYKKEEEKDKEHNKNEEMYNGERINSDGYIMCNNINSNISENENECMYNYFIEYLKKKEERKRSISLYFTIHQNLTNEQQELLIQTIRELEREYGRSEICQNFLLKVLQGKNFEDFFCAYAKKKIRAGVPSLFCLIRSLYTKDNEKFIEEVFKKYAQNLLDSPSTFEGAEEKQKEDSDGKEEEKKEEKEKEKDEQEPQEGEEESPTCALHSLIALAQHYNFTKQFDKALETINQAIEHTPTFVDLCSIKAKIYKHMGSLTQTSALHEEARTMDLADRHLNSKSVKYLLKIGDIENGKKVGSLFARQSESDGLHDMQCMVYETYLARSHLRKGEIKNAILNFKKIIKHFKNIHMEQIDFHLYAIRRLTYRAYVHFLRMQDVVFSHKFHRVAACECIRIYLDIYDGKISEEVIKEQTEDKTKTSKSSKHKSKKNEEANNSGETEDAEALEDEIMKDKTKCLENSYKMIFDLKESSALHANTQIVVYHVAFRKQKKLLMMESLLRIFYLGEKFIFFEKFAPVFAHFLFFAFESDTNPLVEKVLRESLDVIFEKNEKIFGTKKQKEKEEKEKEKREDTQNEEEKEKKEETLSHENAVKYAKMYTAYFFCFLQSRHTPNFHQAFSGIELIELNKLSSKSQPLTSSSPLSSSFSLFSPSCASSSSPSSSADSEFFPCDDFCKIAFKVLIENLQNFRFKKIEKCFHFLQKSNFIPKTFVEEFETKCRALFPHTDVFKNS